MSYNCITYLFLLLGIFQTGSLFAQLRINEFQASNTSSVEDPDFHESGDWIEIYNESGSELNLRNYYLTDNISNPQKWQINSDFFVPSKEYAILWADGRDTGSHTNFKLSASGEEIGLFDPEVILVDEITFPAQKSDISMGRDAEGNWVYFLSPTPGSENSVTSFLGFTKNVVEFSVRGGLFDVPFQVSLSTYLGGQIRYTTDGSVPSFESEVYEFPIEINKSMIVRAGIFDMDFIPGPVTTHSYFLQVPHDLPIISIASNPENFWDATTGIYVQDFKPDWEVPINIELFENIGEDRAAFNELAGAKVNGLWSWKLPQKMLGIYFRDKYNGSLEYPLFFDRTRSKYENFALRASGSDWAYTLFRDILGQDAVAQNMGLATMGFRQSVLYINGQYMGIHNMRSKVNEDYIVGNYGLETGAFDLIENEEFVEAGDIDAYKSLKNLLSKDLSIQGNFDAVAEVMDIENFTDLVITELYVRNSSIGHNIMCWKPKSGGKWQWIVMDLDRGFFKPDQDLIGYFLGKSVIPFDELMRNETYEEYFANRLMDRLLTTFHPEQMAALIQKNKQIIEGELPRHIDRWEGTSSSYGNPIASTEYWLGEIDMVISFTEQRPGYLIQDLANYGFESTSMVEVNMEPAKGGEIWMNGLKYSQGRSGLHLTGAELSFQTRSNAGYEFMGWRIGQETQLISNEESFDLVLDEDLVLTAVFEESSACIVPDEINTDLTLTKDCSPYIVRENVQVLSGSTLTIEAGVELRVFEGTSIIVEGQLLCQGTENDPVVITGDPNSELPWGAIVFLESNEVSEMSNTIIQGASTGPLPIRDRAAVSAFKATVKLDYVTIEDVESNPIFAQYSTMEISNSQLHSKVTGDLINVKYGNAIVRNSIFLGNDEPDTDGIDYDDVTGGIISNCVFHDFLGTNSDAIDIGEGARNVIIDRVVSYNITDKGVSVGQRSSAVITNSLFVNSAIGVAVKDSSFVEIDYCTFYNTSQSVACYEKNLGYAGGNAIVTNSVLSNSPLDSYFSDEFSTFVINHSLSDADPLPGENNYLGNPLFFNPDRYDFEFQTSSVALNYSDNGTIIGAPIFSLDVDPKVTIVQIFADADNTGASEFIALLNPSDKTIDISGYHVNRGFTQLIPQRVFIEPGDTLFLTNNSSIAWWNQQQQVLQWQEGSLSNGGETIQLVDHHGIVVDHVKFDNKAPWPLGSGVLTLNALDVDNHFGENWTMIADDRTQVPLSTESVVRDLLQVYPNPVSHVLNVKANDLVKVRIINLSGVVIMESNEPNIDVSSIKGGIYIVNIQTAIGEKNLRVIIE